MAVSNLRENHLMKITGLKVYRVDLPLHEGNYSWSEGKRVDVFDSTVVLIDTDAGLTGVGEVCPLGPVYLPAYAGVRERAFRNSPRTCLARIPRRCKPSITKWIV